MIESEKIKLENLDLQAKNWKVNHDNEIEKLKELKSRKEDEQIKRKTFLSKSQKNYLNKIKKTIFQMRKKEKTSKNLI